MEGDKMKFRRYQHVERFGNDEVEDINIGTCYIFPKIDGTNSSVYLGMMERLKQEVETES